MSLIFVGSSNQGPICREGGAQSKETGEKSRPSTREVLPETGQFPGGLGLSHLALSQYFLSPCRDMCPLRTLAVDGFVLTSLTMIETK